MKNNRKMRLCFTILILFSFLMSCSPQPVTLDGPTKEAILAYSEAQTDGLLAGLSKNDYATFSKDFDEEMLKAMPKQQFLELKKDRDAKLGAYLSRTVKRVIQNGDFYAVIYDAKFEKNATVIMRVVFRVAEPHQVSGLWFDK